MSATELVAMIREYGRECAQADICYAIGNTAGERRATERAQRLIAQIETSVTKLAGGDS